MVRGVIIGSFVAAATMLAAAAPEAPLRDITASPAQDQAQRPTELSFILANSVIAILRGP